MLVAGACTGGFSNAGPFGTLGIYIVRLRRYYGGVPIELSTGYLKMAILQRASVLTSLGTSPPPARCN